MRERNLDIHADPRQELSKMKRNIYKNAQYLTVNVAALITRGRKDSLNARLKVYDRCGWEKILPSENIDLRRCF